MNAVPQDSTSGVQIFSLSIHSKHLNHFIYWFQLLYMSDNVQMYIYQLDMPLI